MRFYKDSLEPYLAGKELYGDAFTKDEIEAWYESEREGYANLGAKDRGSYDYPYHKLNVQHGYRFMHKEEVNLSVLSIGGAYGDELIPILSRIDRITILEPSLHLRQSALQNTPIKYLTPETQGNILVGSDSVDLVTCFGVLHHIPNVSFVISEIFRVLKPGGKFIVREPIVSMGDWRKPRRGLTKQERGLPLNLFERILRNEGFTLEHRHLCLLAPLGKIYKFIFRRSRFNSDRFIQVDAFLSRLLKVNYRYHSESMLGKIRPTCVYFSAVKKV